MQCKLSLLRSQSIHPLLCFCRRRYSAATRCRQPLKHWLCVVLIIHQVPNFPGPSSLTSSSDSLSLRYTTGNDPAALLGLGFQVLPHQPIFFPGRSFCHQPPLCSNPSFSELRISLLRRELRGGAACTATFNSTTSLSRAQAGGQGDGGGGQDAHRRGHCHHHH